MNQFPTFGSVCPYTHGPLCCPPPPPCPHPTPPHPTCPTPPHTHARWVAHIALLPPPCTVYSLPVHRCCAWRPHPTLCPHLTPYAPAPCLPCRACMLCDLLPLPCVLAFCLRARRRQRNGGPSSRTNAGKRSGRQTSLVSATSGMAWRFPWFGFMGWTAWRCVVLTRTRHLQTFIGRAITRHRFGIPGRHLVTATRCPVRYVTRWVDDVIPRCLMYSRFVPEFCLPLMGSFSPR